MTENAYLFKMTKEGAELALYQPSLLQEDRGKRWIAGNALRISVIQHDETAQVLNIGFMRNELEIARLTAKIGPKDTLTITTGPEVLIGWKATVKGEPE